MRKLILKLGEVVWSIKQYPKRLKNLVKWHFVIWKDHNSDYSKLLDILELKFGFQSEYWYSVGEEKNSRYNAVCKKLSNSINREYYLGEMIDHMKNEQSLDLYLKNHKRHIKKMYRKVSLGLNDTGNLTIEQKEMIAMDIASYKHRKARRLLFKILYHQMENWQ